MPNKSKLRQNQFYCVKCRARITSPEDTICVEVFKNDRPALRSYCHRCDTNLTKFIKNDDKDRMVDKYGRC